MNIVYELNDIVFEWDSDKADKVLQDHKITMQEACTVFFDDMALYENDYREYNEDRYLIIGMSNKGRLLTVAWTDRNPNTRLITAFKATKEQTRGYSNARTR